jgi:hypothetical protein
MKPDGSLPLSQESSTDLYPEPYQFNPYHPILVLLWSVLILSTYLHICLPSGLFPLGFPTSILHAFLFSPSIHATCPPHLILLDFVIQLYFAKNTG